MTAGKLASVRPLSTTNTLLYRCPIDKAASSNLSVVNTSGSSIDYRFAVRDYDQILTLDSSSYKLIKGNVVSAYKLEVTPGLSASSLLPGSLVSTDQEDVTFRFLDIDKPTNTIVIPVEVSSFGNLLVENVSGSFSPQDTITGANTGLTGTLYRYSISGQWKIFIDGIDSTATTAKINDSTIVSSGDYIYFNDASQGELALVSNITGYDITFSRGDIGSTAVSHFAGCPLRVVRPEATATTLDGSIDDIVTTFDVISATGLTVGEFIRIDDELLLIESIATNTLTVSRAQLGTTADLHANAAPTTLYSDQGYCNLNYFESGESVTNSTETADVATYSYLIDNYLNMTAYVYDLGSGFEYPTDLYFDVDRVYRFTQEDASNTGLSLRFSTAADSTEYSTDVIVSGIPGTAGAYTEITTSTTTPTTLFTKDISLSGYGVTVTVNLSPLYQNIYVYDIQGSFVPSASSFNTSTGSNTVITVNAGPYGYVHDKTLAELKVSLGKNSQAFTTSDEFFDSPPTTGAVRSLVTISAVTNVTDVIDEDYLQYDTSVNATTTDKNTGIVIGPGQSVIVYSSAADVNYVLNGFEDNTQDFSIIHYNRVAS